MIDLKLGDSLEKLKELEDNSIDSIVCDPPYEIGFMGKGWDNTGIANNVNVWKECLRLLKPGGHLLAFGGTRTYHRMTCAIEDAGFEIRDCIMWAYGVGFPKSYNIGNKLEEYKGWGTALKPAVEPIVMARKPFKGTIVDNVLKHSTGGINIDACRVGNEIISTHNAPKGTFAGGEENRGSDTSSYTEHTGRWPANFLHDGSDEVINLFPGNTDRFFYSAKTSKRDRNEGCEELPEKSKTFNGKSEFKSPTHNVEGSVGDKFSTMPQNNYHPTVKPTDLMRYLCRLVTPKDGIVLDPFMGSGSTGKAAVLEGFSFIGIELQQEFYNIANKRIQFVLNKEDE